MTDEKRTYLITGCLKKDAAAQRALFSEMYHFVMSIASRYGQNKAETEEIANNSLFKMLDKIDQYKEHTVFELWLRRITINSGIDYYRKYNKKNKVEKLEYAPIRNEGDMNMDQQYLLKIIRRLSPKYRLVFNMFVIDGFSHVEIAEQLGISVGTSKSNLSKARSRLQEWINEHKEQSRSYGK